MKVVVVGAGVIGVTTAYELARDGHEVTVIDRLPEVAGATSFANAGLVAPGHAYTWSSPRAPKILLRSLYREGEALRFRPSLDPALWIWSLKFLRNCTAERARTNTRRKVRLCLYSQGELHRIAAETGVEYFSRDGGLLYLFRREASFERGAANADILRDEGLALRAISPTEAAAIDPALEPVRGRLAGAIYCPTDESGDARIFTQNLARHCEEKRGVAFQMETEVAGFDIEGDNVAALFTTTGGRIAADAFLFCLGVYGAKLARSLGTALPVYPIKGYSVTLPIAAESNAPTIGGVDEDNLVAYARFGDRLRVTATAEFAGYDTSHEPSDFTHMLGAVRDIFPDGADYARPSYWAGLRPMTPEGTPIFGRGRFTNMVFNVGHGHMGWTMSAGSARIAADILANRKPAIDTTGMMLT